MARLATQLAAKNQQKRTGKRAVSSKTPKHVVGVGCFLRCLFGCKFLLVYFVPHFCVLSLTCYNIVVLVGFKNQCFMPQLPEIHQCNGRNALFRHIYAVNGIHRCHRGFVVRYHNEL